MTEKIHGGLGTASFVISLTSACLMLFLFGMAGLTQLSAHGEMNQKFDQALLLGFFIVATKIVTLLGLTLGIASFLQSSKSKLFGGLGVIFSIIVLLSTSMLLAFF